MKGETRKILESLDVDFVGVLDKEILGAMYSIEAPRNQLGKLKDVVLLFRTKKNSYFSRNYKKLISYIEEYAGHFLSIKEDKNDVRVFYTKKQEARYLKENPINFSQYRCRASVVEKPIKPIKINELEKIFNRLKVSDEDIKKAFIAASEYLKNEVSWSEGE